MKNLLLINFLLLLFSIATLSEANSKFDSEEVWSQKLQKLSDYVKSNKIDQKSVPRPRSTGINDFDVDLQCTPVPTNVHRLRPQDIDVVGAMGDSITAGNGADANTVAGIVTEYRGLSWTVGGEETLNTSITIPNILRQFNSEIKGYSEGSNFLTRDLWFNAAVPGARARDMPAQARDLIDRMKNDSRTNFENDWKLISIFIGGNDLCALRSSTSSQPANYVEKLQEGLDILHKELPRALVNVIDILEIYLLPQIGTGYGSTAACRLAQTTFCNYVVTADEAEMDNIKQKNKEYQDLTEQLISSGRYDTRDDFTVVIQPFLRDTVLPYTEQGEVDATFFAPDCFHFSTKGHAMGALNLWNNMLEPVGQKTTVWSITDLKCPTKESPYIFTNLNSNMESSGETTMAPIPISTTTSTVETTTKKCFDGCNNQTEDWIIGVIAALAAAVLLQTLVLVCIYNKRKEPAATSYELRDKM